MTIRSKIMIACSAAFIFSCGTKPASVQSESAKMSDTLDIQAIMQAFAGAKATGWQNALSAVTSENLTNEQAWALAACACSSKRFISKWQTSIATITGTLPETLFPDVRTTISNDSSIKTLSSLPEFLGDLLTGVFASEGEIGKRVRQEISSRIAKNLGVSTQLADRLAFRFDGFLPLSKSRPIDPISKTRLLQVEEQAALWQLTLTSANLWAATPLAVSQDEYSLDLLQTMRLLSEWQYIFGIGPDGKKQKSVAASGLMLATGSVFTALDRFDALSQENRVFSGSYRLSTPKKKFLNLLTEGGETWQHQGEYITLDEQAMLWQSAAIGLSKLRPRNRNLTTKKLFGPTAAFPEIVHLMPILFLKSASGVLKNGFINVDTRTIYPAISTKDGYPAELNGISKTGPKTLARLINAMRLWYIELEDLSDLGLDAAQFKELTEARQSLVELIRLAVQNIMVDYVKASKQAAYQRVLVNTEGNELSIANAGEVLSILTIANNTVLKSSYLKEVLAPLDRGFIASKILTGLEDHALENLTAEDLFWAKAMLDGTAMRTEQPALIDSARAALQRLLDQWEKNRP